MQVVESSASNLSSIAFLLSSYIVVVAATLNMTDYLQEP